MARTYFSDRIHIAYIAGHRLINIQVGGGMANHWAGYGKGLGTKQTKNILIIVQLEHKLVNYFQPISQVRKLKTTSKSHKDHKVFPSIHVFKFL